MGPAAPASSDAVVELGSGAGALDAKSAALEGGAGAGAGQHLTRRQYATILATIGLGIILEWYDYVVYSQLSAPLTANFFPSHNAATEALAFWGVFAVGFVARPAGSVLFGWVGDTYGRKPCLLATVSIMGVATTLIGCLPTYPMVGIAAPVLLALLRLVQGLAMGGEFGCSLVYLHEVAPPRRRGASGSAGFAGAIGGVGFGVLVVMIMTAACSPAQLKAWGWRLPFLLAFVTAGAALLLRLHMHEPREWVEAKAAQRAAATAAADPAAAAECGKGAPAVAPACRCGGPGAWVAGAGGWRHLRDVALQFAFEAGVSVSFWLSTSYMPGFFQKHVGMPAEFSLGMLLANLALMICFILASGWACDRPGVPRLWLALGAYALIGGMAVPMFKAFKHGWAACWLLQLVFMCLLGWVLGMVPVTMAALYPPLRRATAFNFAHNCAMSLLGGLAPSVVTAIGVTTGNVLTAPGFYMLAASGLSLAAGVAIALLHPGINYAPPAEGAKDDASGSGSGRDGGEL